MYPLEGYKYLHEIILFHSFQPPLGEKAQNLISIVLITQ